VRVAAPAGVPAPGAPLVAAGPRVAGWVATVSVGVGGSVWVGAINGVPASAVRVPPAGSGLAAGVSPETSIEHAANARASSAAPAARHNAGFKLGFMPPSLPTFIQIRL
jgi:hypothetical protein